MGNLYLFSVKHVNKINKVSEVNKVIKAIKGVLRTFVLFGGLFLMTGCPAPGGGTPKPGPDKPVTQVKIVEAKLIASDQSQSVNQNGPEVMVELPYAAEGGVVPTSCETSHPTLVTAPTCVCTDGKCRVGVKPVDDVDGQGYFNFVLKGEKNKKAISSNQGKITVDILGINMAISSGNGQEVVAGEPKAIEVLVKNSKDVPVGGIKVFWEALGGGKTSSCAEETNDKGFAACTWTVGEKILDEGPANQVRVSAFYSYKDSEAKKLKENLRTLFDASVQPGSPARLSFAPNGHGTYSPFDPGTKRTAGEALVSGVNPDDVSVFAQDKYGNRVAVKADSTVTLSFHEKPVGATFSGSRSEVTAKMSNEKITLKSNQERQQGVAHFKDLRLEKAGTYSIKVKASDPDLKEIISGDFTVVPHSVAKLAFTTQPGGGTAGLGWTQQPVVEARDEFDNTVTSFSSEIVLAIKDNPGSGALSGIAKVSAVNGVATFSGLSIDKAGEKYTLTASGAALTITSAPFNIAVGTTAKRLAFTTQPGGGTAGSGWAQQPVVAAQDEFGNTVTSFSSEIVLAIKDNPGSGTLSGKNKVSAVNGVATFSGLSIDKAGEKYTLTASSGAALTITSAPFNIAVGTTAKRLAFTTQPGGGTAGSGWAQQPVVAAQDEFGNTVTSFSSEIVLAIKDNPGSGTLSGKNKVSAVNGVATFSGLSIDKAGEKYTLTASGAALTITSEPFNIAVGTTAKRLAFTTQPGGGTAGLGWTQQPVVAAQDEFGNTVTSFSSEIVLAIKDNPGSGTLSGKNKVSAVNGVATFSGLSIDKAGEKYTLTASSGAALTITSEPFNIAVGKASRLAFTTQPGGGTAGSGWAQQPVVTIQDASGNTVTTSLEDVTLTLVNSDPNSEAGKLDGANLVKAGDGVASFSGLSVQKVGKYTLKASSPGLPYADAVSDSFNITHGVATKLFFTKQPGGAVAKKEFTSQPAVAIQDAYGNPVISGADAAAPLTIELLDPAAGVRLLGNTSSMVILGVATWSGLSIDTSGDYVLVVKKPDFASSGGAGALSVNSDSFTNAKATDTLVVVSSLEARGGDGKVTLKWEMPEGATEYNVLRGTREDTLAKVGTSEVTEYMDSTVENGTIYFYAVQAVYAGGTSGNSRSVQVRPLAVAAIESLVVNDEGGDGALVVSWKPSTGASGYTVKYSLDLGKANLGTDGCTVKVPEQTCIVRGLTAEKKYYLVVKATNDHFGHVDSVEWEGIPHSAPVFRLYGRDVPGDGGKEDLFAKVQVSSGPYAAESGNYNVVYGTDPGVYPNSVKKIQHTSTVSSFDYVALGKSDSGLTYYFKATEEFPNGKLSAPELSLIAKPAPKLISAIPGDGKVKLEWTLTGGAEGYTIACRSPESFPTCPAPFIGGTANVGKNRTSMEVVGLTNLGKYQFSVTAIMSVNKNGNATVTKSSAPEKGDEDNTIIRYPAKPELSLLPGDMTIKRAVTNQGVPQTNEEIFFKEGDILKKIPEKFKSAFYPKEKESICEGTENGCGAKIEANYSEDKITQVIDGSGGVKAPEVSESFFTDNKIEASYSTKDEGDGILLKLPVNQRAMEGTAKITLKLTYGLETVIGEFQFVLSPEQK